MIEAGVWCALFALGLWQSERLLRRARRRRRALTTNGVALLYVRGLVLQESIRFVGIAAFFLAGFLPLVDLDTRTVELVLLFLGGVCLVANTLVARYFERELDRTILAEETAGE